MQSPAYNIQRSPQRTIALKMNWLGVATKCRTVFPSTSLILLLLPLAAQQSPARPKQTFGWNWRASEELESRQNAGVESKTLSKTDHAALIGALTLKFKGDPNPIKRAEETRIKFVDLNGDGVAEVIAQPVGYDFCGAVGNCRFWVFQRTDSGYRLILNGTAQTFTVQRSRTNGYLDLVLALHDSATEQELLEYRFSAGQYRRTTCYNASWTASINSEIRLKAPLITPCTR